MEIKQSIISVAVVCLVAATAVAGEEKLLNFSSRKLTDTVRIDSIKNSLFRKTALLMKLYG